MGDQFDGRTLLVAEEVEPVDDQVVDGPGRCRRPVAGQNPSAVGTDQGAGVEEAPDQRFHEQGGSGRPGRQVEHLLGRSLPKQARRQFGHAVGVEPPQGELGQRPGRRALVTNCAALCSRACPLGGRCRPERSGMRPRSARDSRAGSATGCPPSGDRRRRGAPVFPS